ncbi:glycoside hydrolase family 9 protein [Pontiella sulfatireligans]|uniref:Endoglucanase D n=1 Tax=Pontiella sulfatireligans TaxID=2750658 RepID=A0A6C2UNU9_9BACT|nr:glycoside hydrolase family 9 protein [Pontiella sulfatireligans]VGO21942.1 Endoglucanase D [Pontiella sulfatireligans]
MDHSSRLSFCLASVVRPVLLFSALLSSAYGVGTVDQSTYKGLQPELVQGTSDRPATAAPLVRHVYAVRPDRLALTVDERSKTIHPVVPYTQLPGDEITRVGKLRVYGEQVARQLTREGRPVGFVVGPDDNLYLKPWDDVPGKKLDTVWADHPDSYRLSSSNDSAYAEGGIPVRIARKSLPRFNTLVGPGLVEMAVRHEIYLDLRSPLKPGASYTLHFQGDGSITNDVTFLFDDKRLRSEAIQVNQIGFAPGQSVKQAFLSCWAGSAGAVEYSAGTSFHVVDAQSGEVFFTGRTALKQDADEPDYEWDGVGWREAVADVYLMDFSDFSRPGRYRVSVPGIGASFPFEIADTVWQDAARIHLMGLLHQRSGIELGPPWTDYRRPRNFHTEDRTVHACHPDVWYHGLKNPSFEKDAADWSFTNARPVLVETGIKVVRSGQGAYGIYQDVTQMVRAFSGKAFSLSADASGTVRPEARLVLQLEGQRRTFIAAFKDADEGGVLAKFKKISVNGTVERAELQLTSEKGRSFNLGSLHFAGASKPKFPQRQAAIDLATSIPEAWGGWMDAGDFDRRPNHMFAVHTVLDLCENNPAYFENLSLGIPESGNGMPDVVNEGLWFLELARRTQGIYARWYGEGWKDSISLRVESVEHPTYGETSWLDSLLLDMDPPSREHSWIYAAGAAHASFVLKKYDPALAEKYLESALAAMEWAEANPENIPYSDKERWPGPDALRNRAAAYLFKVTREPRWHRLFEETLERESWHKAGFNGACVYARLEGTGVDPDLKKFCIDLLCRDADDLIDGMNEMAWGAVRHTEQLGEANLAARPNYTAKKEVEAVVYAWLATGNERYLSALQQCVQFSMGANPRNSCYTTGMGVRSMRPYLADVKFGGVDTPIGATMYGPLPLSRWVTGRWQALVKNGIYPLPVFHDATTPHWPIPELYIDDYNWAPLTEFTVHESIASHLLICGMLAQEYEEQDPDRF